MKDTDTYVDPTGGILSALRRNPVLYLDIQTYELVILQREMIAAIRAKSPAGRFRRPNEHIESFEQARQVLNDETGRYWRSPGVRMPETREWIAEFSKAFADLKT